MSHPYDKLSPDLILDAVESVGFQVTGAEDECCQKHRCVVHS